MQTKNCKIKAATYQDIGAMRSMQASALREIGRAFYADTAIERALVEVGTLEKATVDEGHYFTVVAETGNIVGTGGWSRQIPEHDAISGHTGFEPDTAVVRGIFVDPHYARRGIGKCIMRHIESDAADHGIRVLRLTATLSGTALYESVGYRSVRPKFLMFSNGTSFESVEMEKAIRSSQMSL
ncbi:MAG: GNAT family N-acetyltransferase [Pseudomonadota bacterium]